jgi:uncharacterized membrane protein YeaQ/YmgE (transglycosylase-associated protein family)
MGGGAAMTATLQAGMSGLLSQASVALINNGGDLGKTLQQLGSSDSLKVLALSMVTAGALQGLSDYLPKDIASATAKSPFTDQLTKNLINNAASATIRSALTGTSLEDNLKSSIVDAIITTGMAQGANAIGDAASAGKINEFGRAVAHAVAGCLAGAAKAQSGDGCSAGAVGAVVGELAAQFYNDGTGTEPKKDTTAFAALMSGVAGALVGGDAKSVNLAASTGANAAANNYLNHPELVRKQALDKKAASGETLTTQEQKERNDLNVASINRNTVIRDGALVVTPEQGNAILKDMQTTMTGLAGYKSDLEGQLQNTNDPTQRAQLQNQINEADNNIRQIASLGKDYNAALYQKTGDIKYQTAFQQLTTATSGNEFADALMMGTAATGQRSPQVGTKKTDTASYTNTNTNADTTTKPAVRTGDYQGANVGADNTTFKLSETQVQPKQGGSLSGEPELPRANASADNIRSFNRQNESAQTLADHGFTVVQLANNQGSTKTKQPDLKINGEVADVYSPTSGNVKSIYDAVVKKTNPDDQQAPNVVVNLADSALTASDVAQYLQRNPVNGLKNLVIIKDGKVVVLSGGN